MRKLVLILIILLVFFTCAIYGGEYVSYLYSNFFSEFQEQSKRDFGFPEFLNEINLFKIINEKSDEKIFEKDIIIGDRVYTLTTFNANGDHFAAVYDSKGNFITDFETARLVIIYHKYYPYYETLKNVLNENNSEQIDKIFSKMENAELAYTITNHIKSAVKGAVQTFTANPKVVNTIIEIVSTQVGHTLLKSSLEMYKDIVKEAEEIALKSYKNITERDLYFAYGFTYSIQDIASYVSEISKEVMGENSIFTFFKTLIKDINSILPVVPEDRALRITINSSEFVEDVLDLTTAVDKKDKAMIAVSIAGIMLNTVEFILDIDIPNASNAVEKLILEELNKINKAQLTLETVYQLLENKSLMLLS